MDIKPRLDRDSRREAILDVATEVFLEVGYSCASMSAIAMLKRVVVLPDPLFPTM